MYFLKNVVKSPTEILCLLLENLILHLMKVTKLKNDHEASAVVKVRLMHLYIFGCQNLTGRLEFTSKFTK